MNRLPPIETVTLTACSSLLGRITQLNSLFWYEEGESSDTYQDLDFEPVLEITYETEEEKQKAEELCKGDQACLYDLFVTKDETFAASTKGTSEKNEVIEKDLSKFQVFSSPYSVIWWGYYLVPRLIKRGISHRTV